MVMHEEHHQPKCSSRPSSKKNKAKKIPQRGLGVAQLEKLRIEEQQKIGGSSNPANHPPPSLVLAVASPPHQQQLHHIPFIRSAISSNSFARGTLADISDLNHMPPIRLINSNASFIPISSGMNLQTEPPSFIPISSGMNLQTEPPSNQRHTANPSLQRDEQRIVGTNLPWPFHPETAVSVPYKVPQFSNTFLKPEAAMSMIYGKSPTGFSKEDASSSNPYQVQWRNSPEVHLNKRLKENGAYDGFLALGYSGTPPLSKLKQPVAAPLEFPLLQSQGGMVNAAKQSAGVSTEKAFYSFLPITPDANGTDASKRIDGAEDGVDTSLKL